MTHLEAATVMTADLDEPRLVAFVAGVRGLAALVDAEPENVSAWREYRLMLVALQDLIGGETGDERIDQLLSRFGGADLPHGADSGPEE